jgi:hypothetical protein
MSRREFMRRHGWQALSGVLAAALLGMVVFLGIFGRVADAPSSDGRTRVLLTNAERDLVLGEMRDLLAASQAIIEAALADDMPRVAAEARKLGMAEVQAIPPEIRLSLLAKLPAEFRQLGFSVHEGMDAIALGAESLGDRDHTLQQLATLMNTCVACHAAYTVIPPGAAQ